MSAGAPDFYTTSYATIVGQTIEKLAVDIVAQTISKLAVDIVSQSLSELAVKITSQAVTLDVNLVASQVTLDVNVTNSVLDVNVTNSVITIQGDVNITNDVLDVNIQSQSADINVNVTNTASVSIDAQTVDLNVKHDAYVEQRITLKNNASQYTDLINHKYIAKFFVHRARGHLHSVKVYVKNTDTANAQTISVAIAIRPNTNIMLSKTKTIDAGFEGWVEVFFDKWWNYDTMFVVVLLPSEVQVAVDDGYPRDGWYSDATTYDFLNLPYRPWIQVLMYCSTIGDLPVSGTVNTIQLPNLAGAAGGTLTYVAPDSEQDLAYITAAGVAKYIRLYQDGGSPSDVRFRIVVDDNDLMSFTIADLIKYQSDVGVGEGIVVTRYDTTNNKYAVMITIPIDFQKRLEIYARNDGTSGVNCEAFVLYSRLV